MALGEGFLKVGEITVGLHDNGDGPIGKGNLLIWRGRGVVGSLQ